MIDFNKNFPPTAGPDRILVTGFGKAHTQSHFIYPFRNSVALFTRNLSKRNRYEYAYGGQVTRYDPESEREHTDHCPHNPLGLGYWPLWAHREAKRRGQMPIPQVLAVEDVQPEFGQPLRVQGVGPIGKTWLPRIDLAGTYDELW